MGSYFNEWYGYRTDGIFQTSEEIANTPVMNNNVKPGDIKYIDINSNTYIYLISENDTLYRAKAASHEDMLLLKKGDNVHIAYSGKDIVTCEKQNWSTD